LYFMLGDVSGKGVAASLLMAHLNAALRALARSALAPSEVMIRANRILAESTLSSHYATLVCGRANPSGEVEVVNAGHCPPLVVRSTGTVETLSEAGLPLGLGIAGDVPPYTSQHIRLLPGDALVLYTDGLTEAAAATAEEYGTGRLQAVLVRSAGRTPGDLITRCLADLSIFLAGAERNDDLTALALQFGR